MNEKFTGASDPSEAAAEAVISDLRDRRGFDHWWDEIDEDIQNDIREVLADEIGSVYSDMRERGSEGSSVRTTRLKQETVDSIRSGESVPIWAGSSEYIELFPPVQAEDDN